MLGFKVDNPEEWDCLTVVIHRDTTMADPAVCLGFKDPLSGDIVNVLSLKPDGVQFWVLPEKYRKAFPTDADGRFKLL